MQDSETIPQMVAASSLKQSTGSLFFPHTHMNSGGIRDAKNDLFTLLHCLDLSGGHHLSTFFGFKDTLNRSGASS